MIQGIREKDAGLSLKEVVDPWEVQNTKNFTGSSSLHWDSFKSSLVFFFFFFFFHFFICAVWLQYT